MTVTEDRSSEHPLGADQAAPRQEFSPTSDRTFQPPFRRAPGPRALVTTKHIIITAIWHMLTPNQAYNELGDEYHY
jgi:hypothetical protein